MSFVNMEHIKNFLVGKTILDVSINDYNEIILHFQDKEIMNVDNIKPRYGHYTEPNSMDRYGKKISINYFLDECKSKNLTDYDGFGYPCKNDLIDRTTMIKPSNIYNIPEDATEIIWYNR